MKECRIDQIKDDIFKIAWLTGTTPYIIIIILFIRGVTLDGAKIGLDYYLLKPKLSVIWQPEVSKESKTNPFELFRHGELLPHKCVTVWPSA